MKSLKGWRVFILNNTTCENVYYLNNEVAASEYVHNICIVDVTSSTNYLGHPIIVTLTIDYYNITRVSGFPLIKSRESSEFASYFNML